MSERPPKKPKTPPRLTASIKRDRVAAKDYLQYDLRVSCDDCSHFDSVKEQCTLGYQTAPHRKAEQARQYLLSGSLAFCRFIEID